MLVPLLALVLHSQGSLNAPDRSTGTYLFQSCKTLIRIIDGEQEGNDALSDPTDPMFCLPFIDGFISGVNTVPAGTPRKVCVSQSSKGTVARVYVQFMQKNPKFLDRTSNIGLYVALAVNYPCSSKAK